MNPAAAIPTVLVAHGRDQPDVLSALRPGTSWGDVPAPDVRLGAEGLVEALALPVDLVVSPYLRSCWA
ncbi:MAG: hypothetical protein H7233_05980 [Pseudorhodobacter sp.]|nr:hypothetical protein [Frankiaceae bacterium]